MKIKRAAPGRALTVGQRDRLVARYRTAIRQATSGERRDIKSVYVRVRNWEGADATPNFTLEDLCDCLWLLNYRYSKTGTVLPPTGV